MSVIFSLNDLLKRYGLSRSTYYERLKHDTKPDKYESVKRLIMKKFESSKQTYGYRRMHFETVKADFPYCEETIRKIMGKLGIKVDIYSKHTSSYHSYKGTVGRIAPNIIIQDFSETKPFTVLHTDVTQVKLIDGKWGYISSIEDETSGEILSVAISNIPNKKLIRNTLMGLKNQLSTSVNPIIHSDQGWQYQMEEFRQQLKELGMTQSMSRKGNCHDNAPIESHFNLLKQECLNRYKIKDIKQLRHLVYEYIDWYNNERISLSKNGLTPVEYRNQAIVV
ncbi:transposase IS150 IS3 family protein [Companilactobacillus versmoldensis DSM 14857 = KCTC 3814]|uniref:Transposase IS150 IS3 family protein n=2 Tax=Companilactobacillus versmoldensis TaxID=194326 RepID=A0A0R1SEY0_9LACO|nr:transposase IS150 IS3 family protein [Companilactobacillus versmoldensis DSM 14857 = KCTC 3814]